jgi:hypothetical protein
MKLKQSQKDFIDGLYSNLPKDMISLEDINEHIMDECIDNEELFDLSEDQEGEVYESYYNLVWDYVIEKMGAPF